MTVATYAQPDYTSQTAAGYKAKIDGAFAVHHRLAGSFAPHEQNQGSPAPEMSVRIDAGFIFGGATLLEVPAQTVGGFTTPATGYHRIDRVVIDLSTGAASRVAGTAQTPGSPGPDAPAVPGGKKPCCQILITSSDAVITNSMITDERTHGESDLEFLSAAEAAGSTVVDFTNLTGYSAYKFILSGVVPVSDNVSFCARFSQDNGSSFKSGASDYQSASWGYTGGAAEVPFANTGDNKISLQDATGNSASAGGVHGELLTNDLSNTSYNKHVVALLTAVRSGGALNVRMSQGAYVSDQAAVNAVRFFFSSGNIASGRILCYGVRR